MISTDMIFMQRLTRLVSITSKSSSGISIASSPACMDERAASTSIFVLPPITPAAPETTCCAISNTAIVIVKVWVTRYTATHALKNHLKNMNVSISCILFFSVTMLISSTHRT